MNYRRKLAQVDPETGELFDGFVAVITPRRKNAYYAQGWMAMAQVSGHDYLANADLTGNDFRVLHWLFARLDFENLLVVSQSVASRDLGIHRQNIQRSIKRLTERGILFEGPRVGRNRSFRLNPNVGWRGSAKNHQKAIADHERELSRRMKAANISGVVERDDRTTDMFETT